MSRPKRSAISVFRPLFVAPVQVMMPHIGRVSEDQVEKSVGRSVREISGTIRRPLLLPEAFGGVGEWRVDLHPGSG